MKPPKPGWTLNNKNLHRGIARVEHSTTTTANSFTHLLTRWGREGDIGRGPGDSWACKGGESERVAQHVVGLYVSRFRHLFTRYQLLQASPSTRMISTVLAIHRSNQRDAGDFSWSMEIHQRRHRGCCIALTRFCGVAGLIDLEELVSHQAGPVSLYVCRLSCITHG